MDSATGVTETRTMHKMWRGNLFKIMGRLSERNDNNRVHFQDICEGRR